MAIADGRQQPPETLITANAGTGRYWSDLWHFRELFLFFAWRDILVRYRRTILGVAWALLRPTLTMIAFTLVFGKLAGMPDDGRPYPLLILAGLLPWQFFAGSVSSAANSLLANAGMITKIYFPRAILPASTVMVNLVDLVVALPILVLLMFLYGIVPGPQIFLLPSLLALLFLLTLGCGLWLAALTVRFRDLVHAVPFVIQAGLYISPVGFSSSAVPEHWRQFFALNPLVAIIDGFRWILLGTPAPEIEAVAISCVATILLFGSGWLYFRYTEHNFAETL